MSVTIEQVRAAFALLYASLQRRDVASSLGWDDYSERDLLTVVRAFLLGYFGVSAFPDPSNRTAGALIETGAVDFLIGNIAVEFAVRKKGKKKVDAGLFSAVQSAGVGTLLRPDGMILLVLFDFSKAALGEGDIEAFARWDLPGKDDDRIAAFNVSYFHASETAPGGVVALHKTIRVGQVALQG